MMGIYIDVFEGFSYSELFPMIKKIGFDGFFSGELYAKSFDHLSSFKDIADKHGLIQETSHSTIPGCTALWTDGQSGDDYKELLKLNLDNCQRVSIPTLVVHVQLDMSAENSLDTGLKRLKEVVSHAAKCGVNVAFENINSAEYLYKTLDYFDESHVGFCYDCGHEACHTGGEHYLPKIGSRLLCTHIHDNDTKSDLHLIPFEGNIDFSCISGELKACGYKGNITLELCYNDRYRSVMSKEEFLQKSFDSAKKIKNMILG